MNFELVVERWKAQINPLIYLRRSALPPPPKKKKPNVTYKTVFKYKNPPFVESLNGQKLTQ